MLDNKLGITNEIELSKEEERITKIKALELFDSGKINEFEVGTFKGLADIHHYLFSDVYDFAGKVRDVNLAKGNFRFAPVMYLEDALNKIDNMPQDNFNNIIKKYIEMNVAHPCREGNGRTIREFIRQLAKYNGYYLNFNMVSTEEMLLASIKSVIDTKELEDKIYKCLQ